MTHCALTQDRIDHQAGVVLAFAYNVVLIPVAMGVLYSLFGVLLNLVLAAAAMAMSSVSVVTNALRVRGFKQPESAHAILHPSLGERLSEYAYLVGIALVALAIGAAALFFARESVTTPSSMSVVAADSRPVSRTIRVEATDALRFTPDKSQRERR
ncbi:MAG: hypothetical protein JOZ81_04210 [Chloroflexi bacterium]|nr:hypothetical protein [Chloroflexota bacterium]